MLLRSEKKTIQQEKRKEIHLHHKAWWQHRFLDSLLLSVLIRHKSWQVLYIASSICTERMNISFCWSANTCVSMYQSPRENVTYKFVLTFYSRYLVYLTWMVCKMEVSDSIDAVFRGAASRIPLKQHIASLSSSHLAFPQVFLESKWCNHTVVLRQWQLGRILVLFHQRSDFLMVVNLTISIPTFHMICWHPYQ